MHEHAYNFIVGQVAELGPFCSVLEIGSRNINGGVRDVFGDCVYEGTDIEPGPGVDFVCDATIRLPAGPYDAVVCCEVFEHCAAWPNIVANAFSTLMPGGVLLLTMAGPGRAPHSATDGGPLRGNEFYANVQPDELFEALTLVGFVDVVINVSMPGDLYAAARKPKG